MSLTRQEVEKVALLARLKLSPSEVDGMLEQLGKILGYVEQLDQVDTANVEPMAHALPMQNVFRDDVILPSLPVEQALANAPKRSGDFYAVPAVLDSE